MLRRLLLNLLARYSAELIVLITGFILTPFLIRHLDNKLLGLQVVVQNTLQLFLLVGSALVAGTTRSAMLAYLRRDEGNWRSTLGATVWLLAAAALLTLAGTLLLLIFAGELLRLPPEILAPARWVILIIGVCSALNYLLTFWEIPVYIRQSFYLPELLRGLSALIAAGGALILFKLWAPSILIWVILSVGVLLILRLFVLVPWARKAMPELRLQWPRTSWREIKELVSFSGMSFIGSLGYLLFYATDSLIITNLLGVGLVLVYNVAQRWDPYIRQLVSASAGFLGPSLTALVAKNDTAGLQNLVLRSVRLGLLLAGYPIIILLVFAWPFVHYWIDVRTGSNFADQAAPILRLLLGGLFFTVPAMMSFQALFALGNIKEASISTLVAGAFNILLSILLVKYFKLGLMGVAWGTVVALSLKNVIYWPFIIRKYCGLGISTMLKSLIRPFAAAGLLIGFALLLNHIRPPASLIEIFLYFLLCGLVYLLIIWPVGLKKDERIYFRQKVRL